MARGIGLALLHRKMRLGFATFCLVLTLWSGVSQALTPLERVRADAQQNRDTASALRTRQQALRQELSRVSTEAEALKARSRGKVLRNGTLDAALRRSQELSGELSTLAKELSEVETRGQAFSVELLALLHDELTRARAAWDRTPDSAARRKLVAQMRALRQEREQVRAALPPSALPAFENANTSDDPEDLLEQADALRDAEDKVRQRLKELEGRIAEAREEREFDRRMNEFIGDESLFDDGDRRLRFRRPATTLGASTGGTGGAAADRSNETPNYSSAPESGGDATSAPPVAASDSPSMTASPTSGDSSTIGGSTPSVPTTTTTTAKSSSPDPTPTSTPTFSSETTGTMSAKEGQPQLGSRMTPFGGVLDVQSLEAEKRRLKSMADELHKRAQSLESKAKSLQ